MRIELCKYDGAYKDTLILWRDYWDKKAEVVNKLVFSTRLLPDDFIGFFNNDDLLVGAIFIYLPRNSGTALLSWEIINPFIDKVARLKVRNKLLSSEVFSLIKDLGCDWAVASFNTMKADKNIFGKGMNRMGDKTEYCRRL